MNSTKTLTVKLYGNLGKDPEIKSIRERSYTRPVYDAILDEPVEQEFRRPQRHLRVFTFAVNAKDEAGNPLPTRWHRCVDWQGYTTLCRKGDHVVLTGFFKDRRYTEDGEPKTIREFIVTGATLLHPKNREQA